MCDRCVQVTAFHVGKWPCHRVCTSSNLSCLSACNDTTLSVSFCAVCPGNTVVFLVGRGHHGCFLLAFRLPKWDSEQDECQISDINIILHCPEYDKWESEMAEEFQVLNVCTAQWELVWPISMDLRITRRCVHRTNHLYMLYVRSRSMKYEHVVQFISLNLLIRFDTYCIFIDVFCLQLLLCMHCRASQLPKQQTRPTWPQMFWMYTVCTYMYIYIYNIV